MTFLDDMQKNRYKDFKGYKFDTWIFRSVWISIALLFFIFAWANNFNLDYFGCIAPNGSKVGNDCLNPFYNEETAWKGQKYLPVGEYGKNYTGYIFLSIFPALSFLILAFIINHFIYNKGKRFLNLKEEDIDDTLDNDNK